MVLLSTELKESLGAPFKHRIIVPNPTMTTTQSRGTWEFEFYPVYRAILGLKQVIVVFLKIKCADKPGL